MLSSRDDRTTFVRDALVVMGLAGIALAVFRSYVGPSVLWIPGQALYFPFLVVYIVLGGETEGPYGPSAVQLAAYVVVLGLLGATLAHLARTHGDWSGSNWSLALAAVGGTVAVLGVLALTPVVSGATLMGLLLAASVVLVAVLSVLVVRSVVGE